MAVWHLGLSTDVQEQEQKPQRVNAHTTRCDNTDWDLSPSKCHARHWTSPPCQYDPFTHLFFKNSLDKVFRNSCNCLSVIIIGSGTEGDVDWDVSGLDEEADESAMLVNDLPLLESSGTGVARCSPKAEDALVNRPPGPRGRELGEIVPVKKKEKLEAKPNELSEMWDENTKKKHNRGMRYISEQTQRDLRKRVL